MSIQSAVIVPWLFIINDCFFNYYFVLLLLSDKGFSKGQTFFPPLTNFPTPAIFCLAITAYKDQNPPQVSFQIASTSATHHGSSLLPYPIALSSNKLQIKGLKVEISPSLL